MVLSNAMNSVRGDAKRRFEQLYSFPVFFVGFRQAGDVSVPIHPGERGVQSPDRPAVVLHRYPAAVGLLVSPGQRHRRFGQGRA